MNIKERMDNLYELIAKYSNEYYNLDNPSISDNEYDSLVKELEELEKLHPQYINKSSPNIKVQGIAVEKFKKINHKFPMLSLNNAYSYEELREFDAKIKKEGFNPSYICELKIDGIASCVFYKNKKIVLGATRGNGYIGEDITMNMLQINSLPKEIIIDEVEVRGEVYMKRSVFDEINNQKSNKGEVEFKNPRNAAGGSLRCIDYNITKSRKLDIFNYSIIEAEKLGLNSQYEVLKYLDTLGFCVNKHYELCDTIEQVIKYIDRMDEFRKTLDYDTDGVVIKINDFSIQNYLGFREKSPRFALAYKFKALEVETIINDIIFTVGRTGVIIPNACFQPILIAGSLVSRATLNNEAYILSKRIRKGAKVLVRKAAEIIPEVVRVLDEGISDFKMIKLCMYCGEKIHKIGNEHYCINNNCIGRKQASLIYFASKDAMNLEGLGEKTIIEFMKRGYLLNITDFYKLKQYKDELIKIEGFGVLSIDKILNSIELSKSVLLSDFLNALGIDLVGKKTAKLLVQEFGSLYQIRNVTYDQLIKLKDVGPKGAKSIVEYFSLNEEFLNYFSDFNFRVEKLNNQHLKGKVVVLTGSLKNKTREEMTLLLESYGASVNSSVSSKTSFIIAGENAGSKLTKAIEFGVKIYSEEEFDKYMRSLDVIY